MDEPATLGELLLRLDSRIRQVEVRIDGRVESIERDAVRPSADTPPKASPGPATGRSKRRPSATRLVEVRRGRGWEIGLGCRGGRVVLEVDPGVDPLDVAAAADEILIDLGR